jgi:hypothetical protein
MLESAQHTKEAAMTTIPIHVSTEQLLQAVERLPTAELAQVVAQVNRLRAQRIAPTLSHAESALLLTINTPSLAPEQQARFDQLVEQREAEQITSDELAELIQLTELIEQRDGERLDALQQLAALRQMTLATVMNVLGLGQSDHAN